VIKLLGVLLLGLPFVVLVAVMVRVAGWRVALVIWGAVIATTALIVGGIALMFGGLS
jgi:hypothetical protein